MKHSLGAIIIMLAVSSGASAATCSTGSLDSYLATGFSCTIDDLQFSNFSFGTNYIASIFRTANGPADILVTPQDIGGEAGFAFSNMNLSFSGGLSNTTGSVIFDAAALSGTITDAALQLGTNSFVAPLGRAYAFFGDYYGSIFGITATHDASTNQLGASIVFPGVTDFRTYSGASAEVTNYGVGSAYVDGYTVLLSTTVAAIPEPEIYAMFLAGLSFLGFTARRKEKRAAA